jgi:hypothetical protein
LSDKIPKSGEVGNSSSIARRKSGVSRLGKAYAVRAKGAIKGIAGILRSTPASTNIDSTPQLRRAEMPAAFHQKNSGERAEKRRAKRIEGS